MDVGKSIDGGQVVRLDSGDWLEPPAVTATAEEKKIFLKLSVSQFEFPEGTSRSLRKFLVECVCVV